MDKKEFLEVLKQKTGLDEEKCNQINKVIESNFILGKQNKEKIISAISEKIGITEEQANSIYNTAMEIISGGLKDKLKNPFKSLD